MKFEIHNIKHEDCVVVSGGSVEEVRQIAKDEMRKRGWAKNDCYSRELKGEI